MKNFLSILKEGVCLTMKIIRVVILKKLRVLIPIKLPRVL